METYLYKARMIGSKRVIKSEGKFESEYHANKYLINKQMVPLSVVKKTALTSDLADLWFFQPKIETKDIVLFCRQFGVMLEVGISIGGALCILSKQAPNPILQKKIKEIHLDIQKGSNLSDAMAKHYEFPNLLISMIRSGEATGAMDKVMDQMADHYDKQINLKQAVKKALIYPALVLIVMAIVIPILMIFVLPGFIDIFNDSGIELPMVTKMVIIISDWMQRKWYMVIMSVISIITGVIFFKKSEQGKMFFDKLALELPLIGDLNKKSISALFSETLALLIKSGVPVFHSLEIVNQVLQNKVAQKEIRKTLKYIREGNTLSASLKNSEIYPPMMISMLRIGEETGAIDKMLDKTAQYYHGEVEASVEQLTVFIEPILMLIIAFFVGIIMIAVILPTFTLSTELM